MKRCLLFTNTDKVQTVEIKKEVIELLNLNDCKTFEFDGDLNLEKYDFALVIGGDGTFLRAADICSAIDLPIVGINLGRMGFLTIIQPEEKELKLLKLLKGDYSIENRMMVELFDGDGLSLGNALNDVVFKRVSGKGIGHYKVYVNDCLLSEYYADGVLIAGPTGSTAYNLALGGGIVNPRCELMIIQPICPHALNSRSIIVDPKETISVEYENKKTEVSLDGREIKTLHNLLKIKKSIIKCRFIRFSDYNFYNDVYQKIK